MATRSRTMAYHTTTAPMPERLGPGVSLMLIGVMSAGGWYLSWHLLGALLSLLP